MKGIGISNFKEKEIYLLRENGNELGKKMWLGKFNMNKHRYPDPKNSDEVKNHIREKYIEKRHNLILIIGILLI